MPRKSVDAHDRINGTNYTSSVVGHLPLSHDRSKSAKHLCRTEELAHGAIAHLRAANADDLQDPELRAFVGELSGTSSQFEAWWSGHIVERRRTSIKHFRTQAGDVAARRHEVLYLPEDGLRMTLWLDPEQH